MVVLQGHFSRGGIVLALMLFAMSWAAAPAVAQGGGEESDDPWVYFETTGNYYKVVGPLPGVTWEEASSHAEAIGAHLVTITSEEENAFVAALINKGEYWSDPDPFGSAPGPWMGGLQQEGAAEPSGGWMWVTGEEFSYTNWASGEPNNFPESMANENRMMYWGPGDTRTGHWNDAREDYSGTSAYVMEISAPDCNNNGTPDENDVSAGDSKDCNENKIPDECETDRDDDGLIDGCDNCPEVVNADQADDDEDGVGDECDECPGQDDSIDCNENGEKDCAEIAAGTAPDCDKNGTLDECEINATSDADEDKVLDVCDNCPQLYNPDQLDADADTVGDACDECHDEDDLADADGDGEGDCKDRDKDGIRNSDDNCPDDANPDQVDSDEDGLGDACDDFDDEPGEEPYDPDDRDGDGTPNESDNCPSHDNADQADADGDGVGDVCDLCPGEDDSIDNNDDGFPDCFEGDESDVITDGASEPDANADGLPHTAEADNEDEETVTVTAPEGTSIADLAVKLVSDYEDPPGGVSIGYGLVEFILTDIAPGDSVLVELEFDLPYDQVIDNYYKYGPTFDDPVAHWYEFNYDGETGAEIDGNVVTLHLTDGQRGDDDLTANGQISEPGAPAVSTVAGGGGGGGSGGGLCGAGLLAPLLTLSIGLVVVRLVRRRE